MAPSAATVREFLRRVYRDGGANATTRAAYLDDLADAALDAKTQGTLLTSSSDKGTSVGYQAFSGWEPDIILALIDEVRSLVTESTITAALAVYNALPVRGVVTFRTVSRWGVGLIPQP